MCYVLVGKGNDYFASAGKICEILKKFITSHPVIAIYAAAVSDSCTRIVSLWLADLCFFAKNH